MGTQLVHGDLYPEVEELQQRDDTQPAIPVCVHGPVRNQLMPGLPGVAGSMFPDTTEPAPLVNEDLTRSRLVVWCATANLFIGFDKEAVRQGNCPKLIAAAAPLEFRNTGKLWVRSDTAVSTVSFFTENWTR